MSTQIPHSTKSVVNFYRVYFEFKYESELNLMFKSGRRPDRFQPTLNVIKRITQKGLEKIEERKEWPVIADNYQFVCDLLKVSDQLCHISRNMKDNRKTIKFFNIITEPWFCLYSYGAIIDIIEKPKMILKNNNCLNIDDTRDMSRVLREKPFLDHSADITLANNTFFDSRLN